MSLPRTRDQVLFLHFFFFGSRHLPWVRRTGIQEKALRKWLLLGDGGLIPLFRTWVAFMHVFYCPLSHSWNFLLNLNYFNVGRTYKNHNVHSSVVNHGSDGPGLAIPLAEPRGHCTLNPVTASTCPVPSTSYHLPPCLLPREHVKCWSLA